MKKTLGIVVLGLLLSGNAYANANTGVRLDNFYKWLYDNGHYELVEKIENEKCKSFDKGDTNWYYNKCDKFQGSNNLDIKIKNKELSGTNIAYHSNPNRDSLIYYLWKYSYRDRGN